MNIVISEDKPVAYYVDQVLKSIRDGEQNPLDIQLSKVKLERILKGIGENSEIQEAIMNEFDKYGTRDVEYKDAVFIRQEAGVKYDYSSCEDPLMEQYIRQEEELKAKMKERSKFLQTIPISGVIDPDTGCFVYPPAKSSKTIIKTTLKKY